MKERIARKLRKERQESIGELETHKESREKSEKLPLKRRELMTLSQRVVKLQQVVELVAAAVRVSAVDETRALDVRRRELARR
jgi:hypothetical protein